MNEKLRSKVMSAVSTGNVAWIRKNLEKLDLKPASSPYYDGDDFLIRLAAQEGELDMVKYFVEEFPACGITLQTSHMGHAALQSAGDANHLDIIRYLVLEAPRHGQRFPDESALAYAFYWLLEKGDAAGAIDFFLVEMPARGLTPLDLDEYELKELLGEKCAAYPNLAQLCDEYRKKQKASGEVEPETVPETVPAASVAVLSGTRDQLRKHGIMNVVLTAMAALDPDTITCAATAAVEMKELAQIAASNSPSSEILDNPDACQFLDTVVFMEHVADEAAARAVLAEVRDGARRFI